jgi:hypothetical protein
MKNLYQPVKNLRLDNVKRPAKIFLRVAAVAFALVIIAYLSLTWYINSHKKEVLEQVTATLNENLKGTLTIGGMEPTLLMGFPRVSLRLNNVTLRDSHYARHGHTLLSAKDIDLAVNALAFVRGAVQINKITISHASAYLYTDSNGYSNTSVFRKGKGSGGQGGAFPELEKMLFNNVAIAIDDRSRQKLYQFRVNTLSGSMKQKSTGWNADVKLDVLVQSLAFSTRKGSFIKNKYVKGKLDITYNEDAGFINFKRNRLNIGGEDFKVAAKFKVGAPTSDFVINIENKSILWTDAAHLLSPNITRKLDMFSLKEPISVTCDVAGDLQVRGDPLIRVNAVVKDNTLDTPGGVVDNCSFFGVFTNEHVKGRGYNDANSAIKLYNFSGSYSGIPVNMKKTVILNLEKPVATGDFNSAFDVAKLNRLVDPGLLKFTKGTASVALAYKADIVNFKLSKPLVSGLVKIKDADVAYMPRKLMFRDISVALDFTKDDLHISHFNLKSGRSIVNMEGSIKNFLNLYYTAPEKIVLNWNIYSPQLHLGEFMGFMGSRNNAVAVKKAPQKGNFTQELNLLFDKCNVDMKVRVDKLFYNNFFATAAKADVLLTDNAVIVKNAGLRHAGGVLGLNGSLSQGGRNNKYRIDAVVSHVDVKRFFKAFNNFGLQSLNAGHLKGRLSSKANVSGSITGAGALVPKSMYGNVAFNLQKGALLNFDPVRNVGRFAFPFRNMDTITIPNLNGRFTIKGEKVTIHPMQVSSSVLNMDIAGVYSFGKGTNIKVDVPLRNPEKDKKITDKNELARRRNRGIVLHLVAADDKDGKVKVKLGKGR